MNKVLLISKSQIYPLYSGGALAQYYFIDGLKDIVEFVLCTEVHNDNEQHKLNLLQEKQPKLKIYSVNTSSKKNSESIKAKFIAFTLKILKPLLGNKKSSIKDIQADDFNDPYFWHIDHHYSPDFIKLISEVIKKESITLVQLDFYDTIDLCFAIPNHVRKIFIHHELRFKRLKLASIDSTVNDTFKNYLIEKTKWFETQCLKEMDIIGVFNEDDAALLKTEFDNVVITPFGIPSELIINREVSLTYNRLLFLGSEGHTPNKLGLIWFLDTIYIPNINKIEFKLNIIGEWSKEFTAKYDNYSKIQFLGLVDKLDNHYNHSILVNPILTGSGLRTKILQSFANKVPVMSTRFGAEGCFTESYSDHLVLFENWSEFYSSMKNLDFNKKAIKAYDYYQSNFAMSDLVKIRYNIYNE